MSGSSAFRGLNPDNTKAQIDMAKAQKRSNREVRKPKTAKPKAGAAVAAESGFPVNALLHKPKGKL